MKKSIKLKHGEKLKILIEKPNQLAIVVKVAFTTDEETGFSTEKFTNKEQDIISELVFLGVLIREEDGVRLKDKSIVDMTLKRKPKSESDLDVKRLIDVKKEEVPKELQKPYEITISFRNLFESNLESLNIRTHNVKNAKFSKWVTPIRLMLDNDKVTMNEFREVWRYLNNHPFWADKVQSTQKLRDKFNTIHSQIKADGKREKSRTNKGAGNVSTEYASQVIRDLQS